jgi:GT2 family glycosyltransferase
VVKLAISMAEPLVTVVISRREGHFLTETSLLSVLADDETPFDLIYLDIASSPQMAAMLAAHAASRGFRLIRHDDWVPPSVARKAVLPQIATKYVAFADNDLVVERGCLAKLVACAEETGAGLVCPLYIQAGGGREPSIHMAGGAFHWAEPPQQGLVRESHRLEQQPLSAAVGLVREKVDFTEYHYVLGRTDLLSRPGAISDDVLLMHEHIDLGLFAREQGADVIFEPSARVTYVAFEPRPLGDIAFYRRRWDVEACRRSTLAFAARWPRVDPDGLIEGSTSYAASRLREVELRLPNSAGGDLDAPMQASELAQSRYALREQAIARGYAQGQVLALETACDLATLLFDGLYRPDGRPFLSHVIGNASALVRYEVQTAIVQAGLLHAVFSHRPDWVAEDEVARMLAGAAGVEAVVRAQPAARDFLARDDSDLGALNMIGAAAAAILAANDVDMLLSGEYRATGRPGEMTPAILDRTAAVLGHFNIAGLTQSARQAVASGETWPVLGGVVRHGSFRLDARNRRTLPV